MNSVVRQWDYVDVPTRPEIGAGTVQRVYERDADVYTARMRGQTERLSLAELRVLHRNVR
jgi:hypothetical protein